MPGMTCEGCKKTILTALQHTNGVTSPQVSLSTKIISFKYDRNVCEIHKIEMSLKKGYGQIYVITNE
ncbi:MAG TPA: copper chaperone [Candidatus Scalindua sp.]|nr:copper chaperone [Candidatus Scalindua sp.]